MPRTRATVNIGSTMLDIAAVDLTVEINRG
jgi:hypothetical protein